MKHSLTSHRRHSLTSHLKESLTDSRLLPLPQKQPSKAISFVYDSVLPKPNLSKVKVTKLTSTPKPTQKKIKAKAKKAPRKQPKNKPKTTHSKTGFISPMIPIVKNDDGVLFDLEGNPLSQELSDELTTAIQEPFNDSDLLPNQ